MTTNSGRATIEATELNENLVTTHAKIRLIGSIIGIQSYEKEKEVFTSQIRFITPLLEHKQ